MDGMKNRKHDSINPIPQRKNCTLNDDEFGEGLITLSSVLEIGILIFGANASVEACRKMFWRGEKNEED
jgi:hypothetical protein